MGKPHENVVDTIDARFHPVALWVIWGLSLMGSAGIVQGQEGVSPEAARMHRSAIVIDTHSDTTPKFERPDWNFGDRHGTGHQDLPRMREGGLDAQFWSIYMPETPGDGAAIKTAIRRIDAVYETVRRHSGDLELVTTAAGIRRAVGEGKIACLMGLEGGHIIEDELAALRMFYQLGVRYMTLTHSFHTNWADAAGTGQNVEPLHGGLTDYGRTIVREMNRLGMMVDISHVADSTFWDVLEVTAAPIIASHSSARALTDHPRNMSDEMLEAVATNGGVVQVNFFTGYIDRDRARLMRRYATRREEIRNQYEDDVEKRRLELAKLNVMWRETAGVPASVVIDHIEHIIKVAGEDHVGLGADWDGVPELPEGLDDVSKLPYVTEALLRRGYGEETIKKVLGENLLRVMDEVERTARRLNEESGADAE